MNVEERYALWLALVRGELTEAQAAHRLGLGVAAVQRIRAAAEQGALVAVSTTGSDAPAQVTVPLEPGHVATTRVRRLLTRSPEFVGTPDTRLDALASDAIVVHLGDRSPVAACIAAGPLLVARGALLALGPHDRPVDLIGRGAYRGPAPTRRLVPIGTTHLVGLPTDAAKDAGAVARGRLATGAPLGGPRDATVALPSPMPLDLQLEDGRVTAAETPLPAEAGLAELLTALDGASVERLATVIPASRTLVGWLLAAGTDVTAIGRLQADVGDRLMRRLLELATSELGPPPGDFAWLVFGSQARREATPASDQDTGLVYDAGLDPAGHGWYAELGTWMTDALETCGLPRCPGGVMASQPDWRHDIVGWGRTIRRWTGPSDTSRLVGADIGLDVRAVAGRGALGVQIVEGRLARMIADASRSERTTARLARAALARRPPSGLWGRVGRDPLGPSLTPRQRRFDVKRHGIQPIVDLARLHTLLRGGTEVNTTERLAVAAADGALGVDLAASLVEGLRLLTWVRLSGQLSRPDTTDDDHVDWATLPGSLRNQFGETFAAIRSAQNTLRSRYPMPAGT